MKLSKSLVMVIGILFFCSNWAVAQEPDFLNPYTLDENTVLLLHFDGDLTNASDSSEDASGEGRILFVGSANANLGQAAWVQNEILADTSQMTVPHADVLNCEGNFTVEGWISAVTYATSTANNWWPRAPVVIAKGGHPFGYWADKPWVIKLDQFNHRLMPFIKHQFEGQSWSQGWQEYPGTSNSIQLLEWYHFVLVGDTVNQTGAYMLHDADGNLIDISTGIRETPDLINEFPIIIGGEGWIGGYGRINMIYDELRISNEVRPYQFPPIIGNVLQVYADRVGGNAVPDEAVQISADVRVLGASTLKGNPTLHYRFGSEDAFTEMTMTQGDSTFTADLPGQPSGTFVEYYISAETVNDDRLTYPKDAERVLDPILNGVAWWTKEDMTLHLTFEGNSAVDSSDYGHEVLLVGDNISYSTDVAPGAGGSTSLNINSTEGLPDTSYLEIPPPSPFINTSLEGYVLDFWFKPTSFDHHSRHYVWNGGIGSVETFAPPQWNYAYRTNVGNVLPWPFELPLNKWLRVRMGRTIDFNFTEFYDANDSLLYVRTVLHNPVTVEDWMEQRQHSNSPITMGRRPRWELDATAHVLVDNVKFYNYPHNSPGALKNSNVIDRNQAPEQAVDVTVESTGGAAWFLSQVMYNTGGDWMAIDLSPVTSTEFTAQIPGQPAGTMVQYYFRFEDNGGRVAVWPAEALSGDYLEFGFQSDAQEQTLDLTFDEGPPGPPVNNTAWGHDINVVENPMYTDDAAMGDYAMYFDGDSSYLQVNSPFMSSDSFTLEFYFKADSNVATNSFFMSRDGRAAWHRGTYRIRSLSGPRIEFRITQVKEDGSYEKQYAKNVNYEVDKWYKFHGEVASADTFFLQLWDVEADSMVGEAGQAITGQIAIEPEQPMGIGGRPDGTALWAGIIDNVSFYNYAKTKVTSIDDTRYNAIPEAYSLSQNYPNPFNPVTTIEFTVPTHDHMKLVIYNVLGREIAELVDKDMLPGRYELQWDGRNSHGNQVSTGVYFYQLDAKNGKFSKVRKMLLMR